MKTPFKILFLAVGCWLLAFTASAQVDVTKRGITPPHNIKNHDYTQSVSKFGQMLGVKKFGTSAGDTLVGFLPVYYLGDSTLKVGAYTVVHSGNVTTYAPGTDLSYTASSRLLASSTGNDVTLPLFTSTEAGLVPLSGGGTSNFLRADGTWAAPVGSVTSVGLSMPTGFSVSGSPVTSSGTLAVTTTLNGPLRGNGSGFTTGNIALGSEVSGTLPIANGGTGLTALGTASQLIRVNAGATALEYFTPTYLTSEVDGSTTNEIQNVSYTASTRAVAISGGGTGFTFPLFTSTEAGLVPLSGGGTTNFLRADGTWAAAGSTISGLTTNYVTKATSATTIGISNIFDNGTNVGIRNVSPNTTLDVRGIVRARNGFYLGAASGSAAPWLFAYSTAASSPDTSGQNISFYSYNATNAGYAFAVTGAQVTATSGTVGSLLVGRSFIPSSGTAVFNYLEVGSSSSISQSTGGTGITRGIFFNYGLTSPADHRVIEIVQNHANAWGVYQSGSSTKNYFNGNTGFGNTSASEKIDVTGNVKASGAFYAANGTAAAPAYTFTNDLDVGLYRPTTNVLGFTVGGTEEMRLLTTGLNIGTAGSNQGNLLLNGSTSGTVTVTTAAAAGTWTMTLPTGAGSSGQVLQTNGSGVTSWATVSASPGGSTTHVQYNNAGSFGGSANFTFDGTNVSVANPMYYATGSNTAPSISFTGDTNLGIYRAAADDLAIVAGGSDIVRVNANGVGIGVVPSIYTLDITSTNAARIPGGTTAQRPTAAARLLRYNSDNETIEWNNGTTWYQAVTGSGSASRVAVWTGGLNLTNDAELGYNTTTNVLSVGGKIENAAGSAGAPTYTFTGDNTMGMYGSSGTLNWSTSGTLRMTMNTDGTTKLTSTASATNSTINTLYYNKSSSAVDDDYLTLAYNLDDSGGNETTFGQIRIISENVTNGSEGGQFAFLAQKAGTLTQLATLDATSFSLNNLTPLKTGQFTATQASAISAQNGMLIYVTSTNATFTSVGHWARENGVWVKL